MLNSVDIDSRRIGVWTLRRLSQLVRRNSNVTDEVQIGYAYMYATALLTYNELFRTYEVHTFATNSLLFIQNHNHWFL